jgi:hypothetical protein
MRFYSQPTVLAIHANSLNKSNQNLQNKFNATQNKLHNEKLHNEEIYIVISGIFFYLTMSLAQTICC